MSTAQFLEFERFLILFDRLYAFTETCLKLTPLDKQEWQPVSNDSVRFGDRVSSVTIKGLYVHMIVGEHSWFQALKECKEGAVIPTPSNKKLSEQLMLGDIATEARKLHTQNIAQLRSYPAGLLTQSIEFSGCTWTVMGFLWAIFAHRSYHLGNIDIYMRQGEMAAPDFFNFNPPQMA